MRFDLTGLGPSEFEDLSQALALRVLGSAVHVFGDGRDGGREATFDGPVTFPAPSTDGPWDGYGVVQAKFRGQLLGTTADTEWFKRQVTGELNKWTNPSLARVTKAQAPEYMLFTTNVSLSGVPGSGGIDSVDRLIEGYREKLPLKGWAVWHYEQICRFLETHADIRRTYAGFITPGDVLARLEETLAGSVIDLGPTLSTHAAKELVADRWIRLGQAGHPDNEKLPLSAVSVDRGKSAGRSDRGEWLLGRLLQYWLLFRPCLGLNSGLPCFYANTFDLQG